MQNPDVEVLINAPFDEEPITDADLAAVEDAAVRLRRGEVPISSKDMLAELGLSGKLDLP